MCEDPGCHLQDVKATGVTLHGYMGRDSVEPFLKDPRCGVFLLCKTSNPSSNEVQTLTCVGKDGQNRYGVSHLDWSLQVHPVSATSAEALFIVFSCAFAFRAVFEEMALLASAWDRDLSGGKSRVGLVVGATDIDALKRVRALVPDMWILAPGKRPYTRVAEGRNRTDVGSGTGVDPVVEGAPANPNHGVIVSQVSARRVVIWRLPVRRACRPVAASYFCPSLGAFLRYVTPG